MSPECQPPGVHPRDAGLGGFDEHRPQHRDRRDLVSDLHASKQGGGSEGHAGADRGFCLGGEEGAESDPGRVAGGPGAGEKNSRPRSRSRPGGVLRRSPSLRRRRRSGPFMQCMKHRRRAHLRRGFYRGPPDCLESGESRIGRPLQRTACSGDATGYEMNTPAADPAAGYRRPGVALSRTDRGRRSAAPEPPADEFRHPHPRDHRGGRLPSGR
jgi:hypothetical protein